MTSSHATRLSSVLFDGVSFVGERGIISTRCSLQPKKGRIRGHVGHFGPSHWRAGEYMGSRRRFLRALMMRRT